MLVHRSPPLRTENLFGYLLRLCAMNRYSSARQFLDEADFYPSREYVTPEVSSRLAHVLEQPEEAIAFLLTEKDHREVGSDIPGTGILRRQLLQPCTRVCPVCVSESLVSPSLWNLKAATACPIHGCRLVDHCPACKSKLVWSRRGPGNCTRARCDVGPAGSKPVPAPAPTVRLMSGLWLSFGLKDDRMPPPFEMMVGLDLRSCVALIELLGRGLEQTSKSYNDPLANPVPTVDEVAAGLDDWPSGLKTYLSLVLAAPERRNSYRKRNGYWTKTVRP